MATQFNKSHMKKYVLIRVGGFCKSFPYQKSLNCLLKWKFCTYVTVMTLFCPLFLYLHS